ncbi:MAG: leucyl aminopeptidase family protein [Hyphomicrobiales bacterium]|nr:leucyl aminopeptidase family protein [Hyphomicrobiales bacterium]MDE2114180.1 leucyl aminopeptidase family protein [Hyphomicrobiales bacterium]
MPIHFAKGQDAGVPIWFVEAGELDARLPQWPQGTAAAIQMAQFAGKAGETLMVPGPDGRMVAVLFGLEAPQARNRDPFLVGKLVTTLPAGVYRFANASHDDRLAALAWLLASYRFTRYKAQRAELPQLEVPRGLDGAQLEEIAAGVFLARDLINTPANDMGPVALEAAAVQLANKYQAKLEVIRGKALLAQNLPLIHAVGRAGAQEPRLVDFIWGREDAPKVTLVGKGVCFDTGGLNIKPDAGMLIMKKDMGGAASALALASMLMQAGCDIRLRVLLPIVENAISSDAFRPGDIYPSRKGLSVEIGNTDAEGRLILADALALADEEAPQLLIDFATLTGAARVALGPDLPPFYTMDDSLAAQMAQFAIAVNDPVWRMPLWEPYDRLLDGKISDLNNISGGPFAGSITAALFLRRFVEKAKSYVHFDLYGWTPSARPARPEGGECQSVRMLYALLLAKYGAKGQIA